MIEIDTKELNKLSLELKKLHRAALPNAVRFTLNDLAFDAKKASLMNAIKETMTVRNDTFFKRYSGVEKATGWEINKMQSEVGLIPESGAERTIERMKVQDEGGTLRHDAIAADTARVGGSMRGKIRKSAYRKNMHFWGEKIEFGNTQGLIRAVTASGINSGGSGKGNVVIYGNFVYEILGFKRISRKKIKLNLKKLYEYKKARNVTIKPKKFTYIASEVTGKKTQELFNINAERQLKKFTR